MLARMTSNEVIALVRRLVAEMKQEGLADALGVTQPTVSRWLKGTRPQSDKLDRMRALDRERASGEDAFLTYVNGTRQIPLLGYVGAGASVILLGNVGAPIGYVDAPPRATPTTVAVTVRGDSMPGLAEEGWTLYYDDRQEPVTNDLLGKLCVVGCADGRILVKKLFRGRREGLFDLAPTIGTTEHDVPVKWAARVLWIKPT